jgi:GT2 family glycosyltransferase
VIRQTEKALWLARNRAVQKSKGDYILLFDDDSRVNKDWIIQHLKAIDFFKVDLSAGVTNTLIGGGLGFKDRFFHMSDVFDTGNAMLHKDIFKKIGLFDRQFEKQRMGDAAFGLRALLKGYNIVSNPYAERLHLKVESGGLRQMGSWDAIRPKKILAPRPIPSVLYLIRQNFSVLSAVIYIIKNIPFSYLPYKFKGRRNLKLAIFLLIPIWLPLAIVSIWKAWTKASSKLKMGPLIGYIDE